MARKSSENFTHRTTINPDGTILYDCPIVIHGQADLANYHITQADCVTLYCGGCDMKRIYFYQTPIRELAEYLWRDLDREHSRGIGITRCMIPGRQKPFIRCPTSNSCQNCPYGKTPEKKELNVLSYDYMLERAYEKELSGKYTEITDEFDTVILKVDLRRTLDAVDPRLMNVLEWKYLEGLSAQEIADRLSSSLPRVYQLLKQALDLAREYVENS